MGMLDLFREWQKFGNGKFRARRRAGIERIEELEFRRMLSPVLTGTTLQVDGTAGPDTISINQDPNGVKVTVDGVDSTYSSAITINAINVFGLAGDDQITINAIFSSTSLTVDGGDGANTLISPMNANTWSITGPNSGTLNGNSFSNIQSLNGGGFNDDFQFAPSGFVEGTVDGGGGIDVLNYSGRTNGAVVDLSAGTATAIGANFTRISDFHGSADNTDVLVGMNAVNTWHINSGNAGDINGQFFFTGAENLMGGSLGDTFAFGPAAFVEGTVNGGAGINALDYSKRTVGILTNLQSNTSTAIGGTFNQIGLLVGSSAADDTLIGINDSNVWNINSGNAGKVDTGSVNGVYASMTFSGIKNLVGGTVSDTFKFAPGAFIAKTINGGGGNNTLDYSGTTNGIVLNLQTSSSTAIGAGYSYIQNLVGSSGTGSTTFDTLIGANVSTDWNISGPNSGNVNGSFFFSSIENLTGGKLNDTFHFLPVGFVSGAVFGGLGTNTIDYSSRNNGIVVSLQTNPTLPYASPASAIGAGFVNVSNFIGTSDVDTLIGADTPNTWNIAGRNTGDINGKFNFTGFENLTGGLGIDIFRPSAGGLITGGINGSPINNGGDWLDYSAYVTQATANLSAGIATNIGSVVNVQNVQGGSGANTLTGNSQGNILVGGQSNDTLTGGSGRSLIIGDLGADTVTGGSSEDIVIGSYTDFDSNRPALASILAEWQSANSFATRVNHLRNGGGLNKNTTLVADGTVHNDAVHNVITGGDGNDWMWGHPAEFTDLSAQDISNTPINNTPILMGSSALIYTVKQPATAINSVITVSDLDSPTLASATIRITGGYAANQDNLGFVGSASTGNITAGSFNSTTGTLTLTSAGATATVAQFQAALRQVTYSNAFTNPSTAPRTVVYQVSDGAGFSNSISSTVSINFAPTLAGSSTLAYMATQPATPINTVVTVGDANNTTLASATVKISMFYFPAEDVLNFVGNAFTGNIVGNFNSATGVLTLTSPGAAATLASFQAALRLVTYQNNRTNPTLFTRTIAFQVSDGSAPSNIVNSMVTVM